MVHEQDGHDSHSRKRSYPFIHWIQTQSPEPDSKRSPEPESDSYKPPLPSPPLLSSKYISFKSGLDTFGARPGQTQHITDNNENAQFDSGKEKVQAGELLNNFRVSQTMSPCLPSTDQYGLKEGPSKRDNNCQRDIETCVNINYDAKSGFKINQKVTRQETLPSDEGQPAVKKSRPSVEITPIIEESALRNSPSPHREVFYKTAAETVKGRRKSFFSQSYDESEEEFFGPYEAATYLPKGRKSPGRQTSPYAKKLNGPGSTHKSNGEAAKIYIQYSNENGSAFAVEKCDKSDNNHNQKLMPGGSLKIYSENGKSETEMTSFKQGSRLDETLGARARRPNFASSIDSGIRKSVNSDLDSCHSSEAQDEVDTPSLVSKRLPDCGDRERERSRGVTLQPNMSQPRTAASAWPLRDNTADKNSSVCRSRKFNTRYPAPEKPRQKRAVIQDMVRPLKQWLLRHRHNPYPTKAEKLQLAVGSKMTLVQVSNWFANARRRLKNVVQEQRCSWSKRLRLYNQCVQGNAELLSISSDDSIWKSEDEDIGDTKSEGGNTEFDPEEDPGLQPPEADHDHDYDIRRVNTGDIFGDAEPGQENSERGDSSVSTNASPTDSASAGSPGLSPSPTIPDSNKYKKNMLWRYLNDVTEAHQNLSKDCKSDGESRSSLSESDIPEAVAQEIVYPPASSPAPAPASGLWEAGCAVPPASDNITISFTHSPGTSLTKTLVPVISPPSRQDLGVDKVKKHLATSQPGHVRPPSGQDGGYGGAQGPVLTLLPPNMRFSSPPGPGTSISYQLPRPAPAIFNPQIIRPLSVLPLPGQYPFIMNWNQIALPQIPISQITSLLPVVPDSAALDSGAQAQAAPAPPRWPGSMSGCESRGPAAAGAALAAPAPGLSAETWSSVTNSGPELDAAVALSQLAHSAPLPPAPSAASLP